MQEQTCLFPRKLLLKARLVKSARLNITCHKQESSGLPCPLSEWFLRQTWNRAVEGAMSWMVQNEATQQATDKIVRDYRDLYDLYDLELIPTNFRVQTNIQCMQQGWHISVPQKSDQNVTSHMYWWLASMPGSIPAPSSTAWSSWTDPPRKNFQECRMLRVWRWVRANHDVIPHLHALFCRSIRLFGLSVAIARAMMPNKNK